MRISVLVPCFKARKIVLLIAYFVVVSLPQSLQLVYVLVVFYIKTPYNYVSDETTGSHPKQPTAIVY